MTDAMLDAILDAAPKGRVERTLMWLLDEQTLLAATQDAADSITEER